MLKTFKEYMSYIGGFRIGNLDSFQPMASLGDIPPKGQGGRDSRGVGLNSGSRGLPLKANYTGQAPGTMRPFLTAAKKIQDKNKKDGYVGNIYQRGWELHSRVLRPARVTVIKN